MKQNILVPIGAALCSLFTTVNPVLAQGTAFTYQGRLTTNGSPANGTYDFRFRLAADPLGNNYVGSAYLTNGIGVSSGLFTTTLDFGPGIFGGSNYWLEVDVRTNNASSYTVLTPLQGLTPTPYAIFANAASNLSGTVTSANIAGTYGNAVVLNNANNSFSGAFTGNGANVTNVNAQTLSGLAANGFWQLGGNNVAVGQFLGSTNNQPVEFWVKGQRALRLEPTTNNSAVNVIGGSSANGVDPGVAGATIGGGGTTNFGGTPFPNHIGGSYGTIGGGGSNSIAPGSTYTTIAGGGANTIQSGLSGTIGGGVFNRIQATDSVIAGGNANTIEAGANTGTISGGFQNTIQTDALLSAIGGGESNAIQFLAYYSVIGGGVGNTIQSIADISTIGGGYQNMIQTNAGASVIGGGLLNSIQAGASNSTIAGGLSNTIQTNANSSTVGGGNNNSAQSPWSTIGGGQSNIILAGANESSIGGGGVNTIEANCFESTIGGGAVNSIQAGSYRSVVAGGAFNTVQTGSDTATIGGGSGNTVSGSFATVPGGSQNTAAGRYSFAAGNGAQALDQGAFVWADSENAPFSSTTSNQFLVRARGGVGLGTTNTPDAGLSLGFNAHLNDQVVYLRAGADHNHGLAYCGAGVTNFSASVLPDGPVIWGYGGGALAMLAGGAHAVLTWNTNGVTVSGNVCAANVNCSSDRDAKEDFEPVSPAAVLARVAALPISRWSFRQDGNTRHIGPMAQDFYAAFKVGPDDKHIGMLDEGGVALAAIQGLNQKLEEKEARAREQEARIQSQTAEIQQLQQSVAELKAMILPSAHAKSQ